MSRRAKKKPLPTTPITVTIESLTHDGRGVAHVDGKVVFIDEALPTEQVEFIYTDCRKDYAEGKTVKVLTQAEDRVEALCPHYGVCGGCSFQHVESVAQIRIKQELLLDIIKDKVARGQVTVMDYINALQDYAVTQKNKALAVTNVLLYTNLYNYYNW